MSADEWGPQRLVDHIQLERLRVGARYVIDHAVLERTEDVHTLLTDRLVYSLKSYVLADRLVDDTYTAHAEHETPATWWQAWKQANLDYLLRWFPVRTVTHRIPVKVRFTRYATYPDARLRVPDTLGPVSFLHEGAEQVQ